MKKIPLISVVFITAAVSSCAQHSNQASNIPICKNANITYKSTPIKNEPQVEVGRYYPIGSIHQIIELSPVNPTKTISSEVTNYHKKNIIHHEGYETSMQKKFNKLASHASKYWGKEKFIASSNHQFVKYLDKYKSRSHIDFIKNQLIVGTIEPVNSKKILKKAIINALLMPDKPNQIDIFSDKDILLDGVPFLLGQVKDQDNKDIHWKWRANRFATYLINNKLKTRHIDNNTEWYVTIPLVKDNLKIREYKYSSIIRQVSQKYGIDEDLIYAIIKTESSFNPFAISHAGAYGLMQVIPSTAGADVFQKIKHRHDKPTTKYLFNPYNNIDTGVGYFYILKNRYFKKVNNNTNLNYSIISAYNGGASAVYKVFSHDKNVAIDKLNSFSATTTYNYLTTKHPKKEARDYLKKVIKYKNDFNRGIL